MTFTPRASVAILQLVFYIPALILGLDFGRKKQTGWLDLTLLAVCRIVGGSCLLVLANYDKYGLWAVVLIAEAIAVLLVVFLMLDLLERLNSTPNPANPHLSPFYFRIPTYLTWAGMAVSIAGYIAVSKRKGDALLPTKYSKVGTSINIAMYFWTVLIFILLWQRHRTANVIKRTDEVRQLIVGVARCIPLVGVRMLYSLLFVATMNKRVWHPVVGKWAVYLFMAAFPELMTLGFVIATLVRIKPVPEPVMAKARDVESEATKGGAELPKLRQVESMGSSVTRV